MKSNKKRIWICIKCRARHKALYGVIERPKECKCGSKEFE